MLWVCERPYGRGIVATVTVHSTNRGGGAKQRGPCSVRFIWRESGRQLHIICTCKMHGRNGQDVRRNGKAEQNIADTHHITLASKWGQAIIIILAGYGGLVCFGDFSFRSSSSSSWPLTACKKVVAIKLHVIYWIGSDRMQFSNVAPSATFEIAA